MLNKGRVTLLKRITSILQHNSSKRVLYNTCIEFVYMTMAEACYLQYSTFHYKELLCCSAAFKCPEHLNYARPLCVVMLLHKMDGETGSIETCVDSYSGAVSLSI